jgi:hypothetical protein
MSWTGAYLLYGCLLLVWMILKQGQCALSALSLVVAGNIALGLFVASGTSLLAPVLSMVLWVCLLLAALRL